MDLTKIQNPDFLKKMSVAELNELAQEIRTFLIENIANTGGHLASNLGVVELTIALYYVFNAPQDKIFFDVGHQCYTHKILTGRAAQFPTLRQYGGLSGFEKRRESPYDCWEAGHSSTSLSAALGFAVARDLNHENYQVVPVVGDAALISGESMEALNQIGYENRPMVIIFNDNNMSISRNVGALTRSFARLRAAKGYNDFKMNLKDSLNRTDFGKAMYHGLKSFKDSVRDQVVDSGIFGEFGLSYLGPVDGHNIRDLIRVLEVAKTHETPTVVHVITQKGHGYAPCENDRRGVWHGVGPFDIATGKPKHSTPPGFSSWSKLMSDTVADFAAIDTKIMALTPAMINGSSLESFFARYPDRSFDCGIAEEHTVTFAAGLAINGMRPYVAIYSSFMQRAYDQINHDVCRMDLPVVFGIDRAGLVGADGETHHGVFDIGFLKPLPHLILAEPKDANEARCLLYSAFHQNHPYAIRFPRGNVDVRNLENCEAIETGTWTMFHDAPDNRLFVLTYGPDVDVVTKKVTVNDLPVTVVNCRFFKPIDEKLLLEIADRKRPVIVYETDVKEGGLGASIAEFCMDHNLCMHVVRMGIGDHYVSQGDVTLLKAAEHIDLNSLYERIQKMLGEDA